MTMPAIGEPCEILAWDTAFFGFRVARVSGEKLSAGLVEKIDAWCLRQNIRCLYFLAGTDDPAPDRLAEANGYRQVDTRVTLGITLDLKSFSSAPTADSVRLRTAQIEDIPALQNAAEILYTETRFFRDPLFPKDLSRKLYREWILKSVQGYAQQVIIAVSEQDVSIGHITCHLEGTPLSGRIGLLGVNGEMGGKGVGRALILGALKWFTSQNAAQVSVVTQSHNAAALHLYQQCGFSVRSTQRWYHKWFPEKAVAAF